MHREPAIIDILLNKTLLELMHLVYLNKNNDVKKCKSGRYYLPKGIVKN